VPEPIVPFAIFPLGVPGEQLAEEYRFDESRVRRV
jgi:hypothetical protein